MPNKDGYHLRWFPPTVEVKLYGHGALASAFELNRLISLHRSRRCASTASPARLRGIPEDSATGSSHCVLAPYWVRQTGEQRFQARQVSRRGSDLWLALVGGRLKIGGHAVCMMSGEIETA